VNEMKQGFDMAALVEELEPVSAFRISRGIGMVGALMLASLAFIGLTKGVRADVLAGHPNPMFLLRGGLLLLLGLGCGWAVLHMASPAVGKQGHSWKMALAAAGLLPLAAMVVAFTGQGAMAMANARYGLDCMMFSTIGDGHSDGVVAPQRRTHLAGTCRLADGHRLGRIGGVCLWLALPVQRCRLYRAMVFAGGWDLCCCGPAGGTKAYSVVVSKP
jgi:Negative regulator of sigma F